MSLLNLGFNLNNEIIDKDFSVGRVVSANKESYQISDGEKEYFGKLTGNMIFASDSYEDFPAVGDFVLFQNFNEESLAMIHKVLDRKTLLKRKAAGKKIDYQIIAANIDYAIIIQSYGKDFNLNRLERYLAMVLENNITPIIFFSKSDLISDDEKSTIVDLVKTKIKNIKIVSFSNFSENCIDEIKEILQPKKTYCVIGSSGVGKTTLLNNLIGYSKFRTIAVREDDEKGRHATTSRQLIILENKAMLIDTPGMRELGNIGNYQGIEQTFDEITELGNQCKFTNCTHTVEKGCAILGALKNGELDEARYQNFIKLKKESEHYERSYLENRKRDKEFGKMVKSIMKHKQKK